MENNNENLFSLAKIKIKNHRSPIKTELHSKESMTIIQEEKKKMSWRREALKLRKRTSEFKEMKGFCQSQCFPTNQETLNNQRALNINYSTDIFIFDFCLLS